MVKSTGFSTIVFLYTKVYKQRKKVKGNQFKHSLSKRRIHIFKYGKVADCKSLTGTPPPLTKKNVEHFVK